MIAHLFVTTNDQSEDEVEVRILYETFMVSLFQGDVEVSLYDQYDYRTALACHRNSEGWEEQPCSW